MKVDNKNFYFDIGQNNRGIYMRVSEVRTPYIFQGLLYITYISFDTFSLSLSLYQVKSNFRTAITVPEKCWTRFRDVLNDYCDKMKKTPAVATSSVAPSSPSSPTTSLGGGSGGGGAGELDAAATVATTGGMLLGAGSFGSSVVGMPSSASAGQLMGELAGLAGLTIGTGESGLAAATAASSTNSTLGGGGGPK